MFNQSKIKIDAMPLDKINLSASSDSDTNNDDKMNM